MSHINSPQAVPGVTGWDALSLFLYNSFGASAYTAFHVGAESLRQKGWISKAQIDLMVQVSGILDVATGIFSSNPEWHALRIFTWGPQWTFYGLMGLAGRLAPVKADRIIAVLNTLDERDWRIIHAEQSTDASEHVRNDQEYLRLLERGKQAPPVKVVSTFNCREFLTAPIRWFRKK